VYNDQQVQLWDVRLIRQELEPMRLDWDMPADSLAINAAAGAVTLQVDSDSSAEALTR
jgi:hypothetical protein